ncbi:MAG: ABC transporter ATP-binding protein/permease [Firmicutes bacterium]|nr:ABC transporter ATP-binding protein/permease [Bacillota bacterium]
MRSQEKHYSFFGNLVFMWRTHWHFDKFFLALPAMQVPLNVGASLQGLLLPMLVLDGLTRRDNLAVMLAQIAACTVLLTVFKACDEKVASVLSERAWKFYCLFGFTQVTAKKMDMDYQLYSSPKGKVAAQKAMRAVSNNIHSSIVSLFIKLKDVVMNLLGFASFAAILSTLNPWIILFLLLSYIFDGVVALLVERWRHKMRDVEAAIWRKSRYLSQRTSLAMYAKDIRIYSLTGWLQALREAVLKEELSLNGKQERRSMLQLILAGVLVFVRDGLAYAYLISRMLGDPDMSIGMFSLYFGAIAGFGNWLYSLVEGAQSLVSANNFVKDYRTFMNMDRPMDIPSGEATKPAHDLTPPHGIRLEHVSFTYPESDKVILDDISLEIKAGENLALVGVNGAGKTTLVKLICGLLHPTAGEIYLDGINITDFDRDEHYRRFGAVFQDVCVMPVSVAQNIVYEHDISQAQERRLWAALEQADFAERVRALPKGIHSMMMKQFNEGGVEFSGGEMQKLLLARALYRDAPILILDEPTAALDPIAENALYLKYHSLTEGKTSIYISHRLSSTRFCDRIVLLDGAKLAETGSHDELMSLGGKYAEMYEVSSKYYREGGAQDE